MLTLEDWLRLAGLFGFFVLLSSMGLFIRRNWATTSSDSEEWPSVRARGKWNYVLRFLIAFSIPIILAISLPFAIPGSESTIAVAEGVRNYLVLLIIILAGLTTIGVSLWNRNQVGPDSQKNRENLTRDNTQT